MWPMLLVRSAGTTTRMRWAGKSRMSLSDLYRKSQARKFITTVEAPPSWRPASILDEWVAKSARPISLRQLMVFGRSLTESRLLSSANYVRNELPIRIAHRIRDMQTLPYAVVTNPHMSRVYELYYRAFESLRRVPEVRSLADNERLCTKIGRNLEEHLAVIPQLTMGILECRDLMSADDMDRFMNTMLRSRISRRVIAEQHIALTKTFLAVKVAPALGAQQSSSPSDQDSSFVGEVFLKCCVAEMIRRVGDEVHRLAAAQFGATTPLPEIRLAGHLTATFPYIPSHLEYILSELLRNSVQAVVEKHVLEGPFLRARSSDADEQAPTSQSSPPPPPPPPPIEVTICEAPQHVIIRVSDQGGGIPTDILPHLWAFSKGPRSERRLNNMKHVPRMMGSMDELRVPDTSWGSPVGGSRTGDGSEASATSSSGRTLNPSPSTSPSVSASDAKSTASSFSPSPSSTSPSSSSSLSSLSSTSPFSASPTASSPSPSSSSSTSSASSPPPPPPPTRPPSLRLGMGLPLSRVYAEYWAGSLSVHSLDGYGADAVLQVSRLGNKNEQLVLRASMDAV